MPAAPPIAAPLAAPSPPPRIAPITAPPAALPPIFAASAFFVWPASRTTADVRMAVWSPSPGRSSEVNRNADPGLPLTRAERAASVTWPTSNVPAGSAWTPSIDTGSRSAALTRSSTWLVSDATVVRRSMARARAGRNRDLAILRHRFAHVAVDA